jgi:hypothetical protein
LLIEVDGKAAPACQDVPIPPHSLVYTLDENNRINVAYGAVSLQ